MRYMVLMQRNFVAEFHQGNASFTRKQRISICEPPFRVGAGVRGNVCDSSSFASLKARSRFPIGYNCTFLLALTAEALMRRNRPFL